MDKQEVKTSIRAYVHAIATLAKGGMSEVVKELSAIVKENTAKKPPTEAPDVDDAPVGI